MVMRSQKALRGLDSTPDSAICTLNINFLMLQASDLAPLLYRVAPKSHYHVIKKSF